MLFERKINKGCISQSDVSQLSKFQIWLLAIRPKTLPAAVGPVLVGGALAFNYGKFAVLPWLVAIIGALLLQIESNLVNDYIDYITGQDTVDRLGPTRVTQSGLLSLREVKIGIAVNILLAILIGLYLIYVGGIVILYIGAAAIIFAILYSAGPYPLASLGLGDLFVYIFFGLTAVGGTFYLLTGTISALVIIASVPPGFIITAILVVNNYRDRDEDSRVNKRTLTVMLGEKFSRVEYSVLIIGAYLVPIYMYLHAFSVFIFLPYLSLPLAINVIKELQPTTDKMLLNKTLAKTAMLSLIFSTLFALGMPF